MRIIGSILAAILFAVPAFAQDQSQRQLRAIPHLLEQLTALTGSVAVCQGDTDELRQQITDMNRKLVAALSEIEKLKAPAETPK